MQASEYLSQALEESFPETPLVPSSPELASELEGLYTLADDLGRTGYRFLAGFALGSGERRVSLTCSAPGSL